MRTTQRKGDTATARAAWRFTSMGLDVSIPLTESAAYDLIVDDHGQLYRVQCKYTSGHQLDLRRIHSNAQGYVVKVPPPEAYDWLYVLTGDGREFLVKDRGKNRRSLNPQASDQLTMLADEDLRVL